MALTAGMWLSTQATDGSTESHMIKPLLRSWRRKQQDRPGWIGVGTFCAATPSSWWVSGWPGDWNASVVLSVSRTHPQQQQIGPDEVQKELRVGRAQPRGHGPANKHNNNNNNTGRFGRFPLCKTVHTVTWSTIQFHCGSERSDRIAILCLARMPSRACDTFIVLRYPSAIRARPSCKSICRPHEPKIEERGCD